MTPEQKAKRRQYRLEYSRQYHIENREFLNKRSLERYYCNREKILARQKENRAKARREKASAKIV